MNRLTKGDGQNQVKELCVLRYNLLGPFLFLVLIFIFLIFLFLYVIICLFSLVLHRFSVFKHVRSLVSRFCSTMFLFFWVRV